MEVCANEECDNHKQKKRNEFFDYPHPPKAVEDVPPEQPPDDGKETDPSPLPAKDTDDSEITVPLPLENPIRVEVALRAVDAPEELPRHPLCPGINIVGRKDAQVILKSRHVSRKHARIHVETDQGVPRIAIEDLGSPSGTFVNGEKLEPKTQRTLQASDFVQFARLKYRLEIVFVNGGAGENQKQEKTAGTLEYGNGQPPFMKS